MRRYVVCVGLLLLMFVQKVTSPPAVHADPGSSYQQCLPLIWRQPVECNFTAEERALFGLLRDDPDQARPRVRCYGTLAAVAAGHAQDMADRDYVGHITPEGKGANQRVREAGYPLPADYGVEPTANDVEVIGVGFKSANSFWETAMESSDLSTRLLGLNSFYARQIECGIGYRYDPKSRYKHYWVIITARRAP